MTSNKAVNELAMGDDVTSAVADELMAMPTVNCNRANGTSG